MNIFFYKISQINYQFSSQKYLKIYQLYIFNCVFSLQPGGNSSNGLKASDVDPRLVFHHGVPSAATKFTCDNIHNILALSTKYVHCLHCQFFYVHM